jgi:hypothetical protein
MSEPVTQPSDAQLDALQSVKYPKGWNGENPAFTSSPFAYNSSYTAPAYLSGQSGGGSPIEHSNQFNSVLSQPKGANYMPYQNMQSYLGHPQNGSGVVDVVRKAHGFIKKHKLVSRALHLGAKFKPGLKKYGDAADLVGYGNYNFYKPIRIVPERLVGESARRFRTMPMGPQKPAQF